MAEYEYCFQCDAKTGRAGRGDDSLYDDDGNGPYCERCYRAALYSDVVDAGESLYAELAEARGEIARLRKLYEDEKAANGWLRGELKAAVAHDDMMRDCAARLREELAEANQRAEKAEDELGDMQEDSALKDEQLRGLALELQEAKKGELESQRLGDAGTYEVPKCPVCGDWMVRDHYIGGSVTPWYCWSMRCRAERNELKSDKEV